MHTTAIAYLIPQNKTSLHLSLVSFFNVNPLKHLPQNGRKLNTYNIIQNAAQKIL